MSVVDNEEIHLKRHEWADIVAERNRLKAQLERRQPLPKGTEENPHMIFCTYCLSNKFQSIESDEGFQVLECGECGSVAKIEWNE